MKICEKEPERVLVCLSCNDKKKTEMHIHSIYHLDDFSLDSLLKTYIALNEWRQLWHYSVKISLDVLTTSTYLSDTHPLNSFVMSGMNGEVANKFAPVLPCMLKISDRIFLRPPLEF